LEGEVANAFEIQSMQFKIDKLLPINIVASSRSDSLFNSFL
jgi:hypothetical protein